MQAGTKYAGCKGHVLYIVHESFWDVWFYLGRTFPNLFPLKTDIFSCGRVQVGAERRHHEIGRENSSQHPRYRTTEYHTSIVAATLEKYFRPLLLSRSRPEAGARFFLESLVDFDLLQP